MLSVVPQRPRFDFEDTFEPKSSLEDVHHARRQPERAVRDALVDQPTEPKHEPSRLPNALPERLCSWELFYG